MMKFLFDGFLFRFFENFATIITPWGDKYKLVMTTDRDNPFHLMLLQRRNPDNDIEQLAFERELKMERTA